MATSTVTQQSADVFKTGRAGQSSPIAVRGIQQTEQLRSAAETSGVKNAIASAAKNIVETGIEVKGAQIEQETAQSFEALSAATVLAEEFSAEGRLISETGGFEDEDTIRESLRRHMGIKDSNAPGVDEAFKDFTALRQAQDRGVITAEEVRIRARARLTDLKNTYPGFADEIIKVAASRLGRDVTSSDFQDAVTRLNTAETARAKAAGKDPLDIKVRKEVAELEFLGFSTPVAMRTIANKRAHEFQVQSFSAKKAANAAFSEDFARMTRSSQEQASNDSITQILALNKAGETNPQDILQVITNSFAKQRTAFQQQSLSTGAVEGVGGFGITSANVSQSMTDIALQSLASTEANIKSMAEDNSLLAWYTQATASNTAAAEFYISNIPGISGMHATVGKEQTGVFLETIFRAMGKPGALSQLASVDDKLKGQLSMFDFFGRGQASFADLLEGKSSNTAQGLQTQQIFFGGQVTSPGLSDKEKVLSHSNAMKIFDTPQLLESYNNPEALKSIINNPGQRKVFAETLSKARVKTSKAFAAEIMLAKEFEDSDNPIVLAIEDGKIVIKGEVSVSKLQPAAPGVVAEDPAVTANSALRSARRMTQRIEQMIQIHNLYEGSGVIQEGTGSQSAQESILQELSAMIK